MHWISLSFLEGFSPRPVTAPLRVQGSPVWNFFHLLTSRVYRVLFYLYDCVSSFVFKFGREASIEGLLWEGTTGVCIALLLPESALIFTFWELRDQQHYYRFICGQNQVKERAGPCPSDRLLHTEVGVWGTWGTGRWGSGLAEQASLTSRRALRSQS